MKSRVLVVGLGEVGKPIYELIVKSGKFYVYGYDIKNLFCILPADKRIDYLHICIPYSDKFIEIVMKYIRTYQPKLTIIHSTVPPYTTSKITSSNNFSLIVHSPVRGMHNDMLKDLKRYIKFIGPTTPKSAIEAKKHLEEIGFVTKVLSNASETELGKLLETSYVGGMIALWQEMERISRNLGINFVKSSEILRDTDAIRQDRPMWYPDEIGGHCIMPNIILLLESCRNYNVHSFIFPEVCQSNAKIQIERMHRNPILEKTIDDMKELFKKSRKSRNG